MLFIVKSYPLNAIAIKTLQQAFRRSDPGQALVLIDDGVYYAQQTDDGLLSDLVTAHVDVKSATNLFALQEDMALRGVSEGDKLSVTPIPMDEFVTLTYTFYPLVYL